MFAARNRLDCRLFPATKKSQHVFTQNCHFIEGPTTGHVSLNVEQSRSGALVQGVEEYKSLFFSFEINKRSVKEILAAAVSMISRASVCSAAANKKPA